MLLWGATNYANFDVKVPGIVQDLDMDSDYDYKMNTYPAIVVDSLVDMKLDPNQSLKVSSFGFWVLNTQS